ncbi:MAG: hypothetical protein M3352_04100 [Bacteroidota bacterium]|nr:hypothetical protein [Bacteroidota bacterium]
MLSPFDGSTMYLALITYDNSLNAMRTIIADYEGGFADLITINDSTWLIDLNNDCLQPVAAGKWRVPAPDWINNTDHNLRRHQTHTGFAYQTIFLQAPRM